MEFPNSCLVLLVDDEQMIRTVLRIALERNGYSVLEASDGVQALAIFHEHEDEIALLLTDVQMPEMGGVELARHVTAKRPDIPVLFISGLSGGVPKELSRHSCIRKPFVPSEIIERIAQMALAPRNIAGEDKGAAA